MSTREKTIDKQSAGYTPTLKYLIYRCCERFHISDEKFWNAEYATQIDLLAFELLRQREEQSQKVI